MLITTRIKQLLAGSAEVELSLLSMAESVEVITESGLRIQNMHRPGDANHNDNAITFKQRAKLCC